MALEHVILGNLLFSLKALYGIVFIVFVFPICLPFTLLYSFYCSYLQFLIKASMEDLQIVNNLDEVWMMQHTDENRAYINSIMLLDGSMTLKEFQNLVQVRLINARAKDKLVAAKFQMVVHKQHRRFVWKADANFNIANHVVKHEGPVPSSQSELEDIISEYCSKDLTKADMSPWMMILIPTEQDGCAILFRCHHIIGDGISLTSLMLKFMVDRPPKQMTPIRFGSSSGKYWKLLQATLEGPFLLLQQVLQTKDDNPLHGPSLSGKKRVTWINDIDLRFVKDIKDSTGTTVNDVLMSVLAMAFRKYFQRKGWKIPKEIKAFLPIDMRSRKSDIVIDNQFSLISVGLPLHIGDSLVSIPVKQLYSTKSSFLCTQMKPACYRFQRCLQKTRQEMNFIKIGSLPIANYFTIIYCMANLPHWINELVFGILVDKCSLVLSNVPGPPEPVTINNITVQAMNFWVPSRGKIGVGVSILSYNGKVSVGIIGDTGVMENPHELIHDFKTCLKQFGRLCRLDSLQES